MLEPVVGSTTDQQLLDAVNKLHTLTEERWAAVQETVKHVKDDQVALNAAINAELPKIKAVHDQVQELQRSRRHALPDDSPLADEITGDKMSAKGGWKSFDYTKVLSLPANHAILRSSDKEELDQIQNYHDACLVKFWMKIARLGRAGGPQAVWAEMVQDEEFKTYCQLRERAGFGGAEELQGQMAKGFIKIQHDDREDQYKKTGGPTLMSPTLIPNLDFTLLSAQLIQKMRLDLVVAAFFAQKRLTRHSQKFPIKGADAMGVWGNGVTQKVPGVDDPGTGTTPSAVYPNFLSPNFFSALTYPAVQFDVEPLLTYLAWNDDMEEDSVISWLPEVRDEASYGNARALDRAILDGDKTATHQDTDVGLNTANNGATSNDFRRAFYGIRKYTRANYAKDNSGGIFDVDDAHTLRASMGLPGMRRGFGYFMNLKTWFQQVGAAAYVANASTNPSGNLLRTLNTIGDGATLRTGQIGELYGQPVMISEFVRIDTTNAGINGASGNTLGLVIAANGEQSAVGMFNDMRIVTESFPLVGWNVIMAKARVDFKPLMGLATTTPGVFDAGVTNLPFNQTINNA
jgi:hypothetical protein